MRPANQREVMTAPRQLLRGDSYLVTRRCFQRQFLLRPGAVTNEVLLYQLALAAQRTGVKIHAYCVLSNHYHLVVTDPDARLPEFHQQLDSVVARAINALYGRWETFWKPGSYSAVPLRTPEDILDKTAYVLANPVAAGLVRRARAWPGLWSAPGDLGKKIEVRRPAHFFDPAGYLPERLELEVTPPPGFASPDVFRHRLEAALAEREGAADRRGRRFLGARRVLKQDPYARPAAREKRRGLNPRVAARDTWKRVELVLRLKTFLAAYRDALLLWREGRVEPIFPAGTYLMRVAHGVACAGAG